MNLLTLMTLLYTFCQYIIMPCCSMMAKFENWVANTAAVIGSRLHLTNRENLWPKIHTAALLLKMYLEAFPETGHKKFCNPIRIVYLNPKCMNVPKMYECTQKYFRKQDNFFFQNSNTICIFEFKNSKARNCHFFIMMFSIWPQLGLDWVFGWVFGWVPKVFPETRQKSFFSKQQYDLHCWI